MGRGNLEKRTSDHLWGFGTPLEAGIRPKFPHGRNSAVPGVKQAKRPFVGVEAFEAGNAAVEYEAHHAAAFKHGAERDFGCHMRVNECCCAGS